MTTPSAFESAGFSIHLWKPDIEVGPIVFTPRGQFVGKLDKEVSAYSHDLNAVGGFGAARFSIAAPLPVLEEMLWRIGSHVEAYDPGGDVMWEGFVNQITLNLGPFSAVIGPLLDVGNRVLVVYAPLDTSSNPPTAGDRTVTVFAEDFDSQRLYGALEVALSAGEITAAEAIQVRNVWLAENAFPVISKNWGSDITGEPSLDVECLGYVERMNYVYNQTASSGTYTMEQKMADILDADPNGLFSSANASIFASGLLVPRYENDDDLAWSLMKDMTARGDASYNKCVAGVYEGRRFEYRQANLAPDYYHSMVQQNRTITTAGGEQIGPWKVRPGRWMIFTDFMFGSVKPGSDLRRDPRAVFIERATFTAPNALTVNGGHYDTISQRLAQLGLSGVG